MSNRSPNLRRARISLGVAAIALMACDTNVLNPSLIATSDLDPSSAAAQSVLTLSAQQAAWVAYNAIVYAEGVFTGEAWDTGVNVAQPDFGRRTMSPLAGNNQAPIWWNPLQRALAANEQVVALLHPIAGSDTSQNLARASFYSGMLIQHMAESSCVGVISSGPALTPKQTLDTAIVRLQMAVAIGNKNGGVPAESLATAANVALAQIYLQQGLFANAVTAAAGVPANFAFKANYIVNLANQGRVANLVYEGATFGASGSTWVVPPAYQALNDPRVPWIDLKRLAYDTIEYVQAQKYTSDASPIRIVSGLEASYISAEANLQLGNPAPALALIAVRRAAGGQPPFAGSGTAAILLDLLDQKARDFYMEGKKMGDYQRNPAVEPYVSPAGTPYYLPNVTFFGNEICFPLTLNESQANTNFPSSYVSPQYVYPPGLP